VKVGFLVLLCVYDAKVQLFMQPFFARSSAEGMRMFADEAKRPDGQIGQHPEDFSLHRLGEVDQTNGMLIPEVAPVALATALELVARLEAVS